MDRGYLNIQASGHAIERELRETLEMYVACRLLDAGKTLLPTVRSYAEATGHYVNTYP